MLGGIREFFLNEKGDEFNKSFLFENEMTGSYFDLLNQKDSIANIQAIMNKKLIIAPFDQVYSFFDNKDHWQRLERVIAENLVLKKAKREYEFVALSTEERYKKLKKLIQRPNYFVNSKVQNFGQELYGTYFRHTIFKQEMNM
jgi:hypothetical protein